MMLSGAKAFLFRRSWRRAFARNNISATVVRLNRRLLEEAYPGDIVTSPRRCVYPDAGIETPSPEDSRFVSINTTWTRKEDCNTICRFPNERRQIKPNEDVRIANNRLQISGQTAVFNIDGLLTKVIFDKNPGHEFYVEESMPLPRPTRPLPWSPASA